jgi:hypothetical protein
VVSCSSLRVRLNLTFDKIGSGKAGTYDICIVRACHVPSVSNRWMVDVPSARMVVVSDVASPICLGIEYHLTLLRWDKCGVAVTFDPESWSTAMGVSIARWGVGGQLVASAMQVLSLMCAWVEVVARSLSSRLLLLMMMLEKTQRPHLDGVKWRAGTRMEAQWWL